jgi:hypothetical protein
MVFASINNMENKFNISKIDTSDFMFRDIAVEELDGMFGSADAVLNFRGNKNWDSDKVVTRREKRLAHKLLKAARWIEREAYVCQRLQDELPEQAKKEIIKVSNHIMEEVDDGNR